MSDAPKEIWVTAGYEFQAAPFQCQTSRAKSRYILSEPPSPIDTDEQALLGHLREVEIEPNQANEHTIKDARLCIERLLKRMQRINDLTLT